MKSKDTSRALLLEQLERRCMLAGDVLMEFADDRNERRSDVNRSKDQAAFIDTRIKQNLDHKSRSKERNDSGRSRHHKHADVNDRSRSEASRPEPGQISTGPVRLQSTNSVQSASKPNIQVIFVPRVETTNRSSSEDSGNSSNVNAPSPTSNSASAPSFSSNAVQLTTVSEDVAEETAETSTAKPPTIRTEEVAAKDTTKSAIATTETGVVSATARSTYINPEIETPDTVSAKSNSNIGSEEAIDLSPLLRHDLPAKESEPDDKPWEIDSDSLSKLREATKPQDDTTDQYPISTDSAIASWFGQETGLIDDIECQTNLPSMLQEAPTTIGEIVLDVTVGHHRSVGLIAGTDIEDSTDATRDIILAAIAEEQSALIAEVLPEPTEVRVSGFAYSGAAIIATLAVNARRKKTATMESSR